tara:strand:- start:345 stop:887 length:543 start_codon:yes stop_codon:yes gene_type:complete
MLGLGQSLSSPSFIGDSGFSYSRSVIRSTDGWTLVSVDGSPTLEYNQTAPDSSTGWMKLTFDTTQTNYFAIQNTSILSGAVVGGSVAVIKHDVYFHNAALWGDDSASDDDIIKWQTLYGLGTQVSSVPTDQAVTVTHNVTAINANEQLQFRNELGGDSGTDYPLANAELYIKNIDIQITY